MVFSNPWSTGICFTSLFGLIFTAFYLILMLTILIYIFITFNLIIFLLNKNRKCQCSTVSSVDRKYSEHQKLEGLLLYSVLQGPGGA